jgi:hypothetical protein
MTCTGSSEQRKYSHPVQEMTDIGLWELFCQGERCRTKKIRRLQLDVDSAAGNKAVGQASPLDYSLAGCY